MNLRKLKAPNTYLIIFSLIVVVAALTWVLPGGKFETEVVDGREMVIPESFQRVEAEHQGIGDILMAPIRGFVDAALIIGFVLVVGGAFSVFQDTDAINAVIRRLAKAHDKSKLVRMMTIPLFMIIFSLGGAVFGMAEETIPFVLIFVPLALALGYDSIVGVAIPFVGAGAGFAGAFFNPFTIGIAQGIADVPLFSGFEYRFVVWLITTTVVITFVMLYARRVQKNPERSLVADIDRVKRQEMAREHSDAMEDTSISGRQKWVLITFAASMVLLVVGVLQFHWYIVEIAALFLAMGITVGIVGGLGADDITNSFVKGAQDLVGTALIIGLARGILVIAQDGLIIGTMLHAMSGAVGAVHPIVSSQLMFLVQTLLNFFVPSGSGQAALTMPLMAPLADLVGVARNTAVLAYQFGDGFSNMIIPTSAVLMGALSLAKVPWEKWARWILPLELVLLAVGFIMLIPPYFFTW